MSRRGGRGVALRDDNHWMCRIRRERGDSVRDPGRCGALELRGRAHIAAALNLDCPPAGDPGEDAWGHDALIKAARRLHGFAWLSPGRLWD